MVHHHPKVTHNKLRELLVVSNQEIMDVVHSKTAGYWNGLYVFVVLGLSVIPTFFITLIPTNSYFEFRTYWYEMVIDQLRNTLVVTPMLVLIVMMDCYFCFNIESMVSIRTFLRLGIPALLANVISFWLMCVIWTVSLGYNLPIPFNGWLWLPILGIFFISIWIEFPYKLRQNKTFRKRLMYYLTGFSLIGTTIFQYDCITVIIPMVPLKFQWILAIILPMLRSSNFWLVDKCYRKVVLHKHQTAKFRYLTFIRSINTIYVAVILGNVTATTLYSISGVEFLLQFYSCYQVIRLYRQTETEDCHNEERKKTIDEIVRDLVTTETIEVLASLAYSVTLAVAYYGPNATILGNIRNSYWTYEEIQDIDKSLAVVFKIAFIDLIIALVCGVMLWVCCRINLFHVFCTIMKTNWIFISLIIAFIMSRVCYEKYVNFVYFPNYKI